MNAVQEDRALLMRQASDRAARIGEFREELMPRRHTRLHVIASRVVTENGRIVTRLLIDGSLELGRGRCYWLSPVMDIVAEKKSKAA